MRTRPILTTAAHGGMIARPGRIIVHATHIRVQQTVRGLTTPRLLLAHSCGVGTRTLAQH